jgi:hypothetical protein
MTNFNDQYDESWARFLPAISGFYTSLLGAMERDPHYTDNDRPNGLPAGMDKGFEGLDYLTDQGYFQYDYSLYSAGHAALDLEKSKEKEGMVSRRGGHTTLVGDSGGFQIGKGVIKLDWERFYEMEDDPSTWIGGKYVGDADKVRMKILRWLEATADWSMTLDVPSWAALPQNQARTGLKNFADCLRATLHNNDFFVKNREPGATKFLNVLQGGNWTEAEAWYQAVKDYPFEGWAFGAANVRNMYIALRRLIIMRDEKMLEGKDWIHILGISKLDWACMATAIQRELRKEANPNITVSFDCASPFISAANGLMYTDSVTTGDKFAYPMESFPDQKMFKGSNLPFPNKSPIGDMLTMGDLCVRGEGDLNKNGKETKTSWDTFSYGLIMAHNTAKHIESVIKANRLVDIESSYIKPDIRDWKKLKSSDKSDNLSVYVPRNILYFNHFVEELFQSEKPMDLLEKNHRFLDSISNNVQLQNSDVAFANLFEMPETANVTADTMDEEKLNELERSIMGD